MLQVPLYTFFCLKGLYLVVNTTDLNESTKNYWNYYPECHLAGVGHVRVWFPAEEIDEEWGGVEHEHGDEEVIQQRDGATQEGHGGGGGEVQRVQLHPGQVSWDNVRHLRRQSEVSIVSEDQSEVSIILYNQSEVSIITCSRAGLSLSLDKVRINSVKMHRRMFLEKSSRNQNRSTF